MLVPLAIAYLGAWVALMLWIAGDWCWVEGWLFGVWLSALSVGVIVWLKRNNPSLLAERFRRPGTGGQKGWDRAVVMGLRVGQALWVLALSLDPKRVAWSPPLPIIVKVAGGLMLLPSAFFFARAFRDNSFLSPLVRIQAERKQHVVDTGVYGVVRHPMYLGAVLMFAGAPLMIGSLAGLVVGAGMITTLVLRIGGEEKMLVAELEGYAAYREKVRWRLLPFVW